MGTKRTVIRTSLAVLTAGLSLLGASPGRAADLTYTNRPAGNVVANLSRQYGITIVFRSPVNANVPVSYSVADADTPAGRLEAVSDLANALGLDFQKVYVVSKVDAGATIPEVKVDSNGYVVFASTKVSARDAIQTVAAVDGAIAPGQRRGDGGRHPAEPPHDGGGCGHPDCQADRHWLEGLLRNV